MSTLLSRLVLLPILLFPALSFAITIQGHIHPERYTFFLTENGGEMLRDMNNEAVSVKLNNKAGFNAEAQNMAAAANISPLLYAASPLEQNFIRYDGKPVKALTCLITPRTMPGIIAGCLLVILPAMGLFFVADLMGGAKNLLIGNVIKSQFLNIRDWPFGAATSICLTLVMGLMLLVYYRAAKLLNKKVELE